jgi:hypothetical protein
MAVDHETLLRRFTLLVAVSALAAYAAVYALGLAWPPIRSDGFSYHVYLPSWFLFHDPSLEALSRDCCGGTYPQFSGLFRWPHTGRWMDPHPMGVAVLASPFFLAAHALTRWSNLSPDGFSLYYQLLTAASGVFYLVVGLAFLQRTLEGLFTPGVVVATLATTTWGTNLFHYGTYDSYFSHVFSFCLLSALLWLTPRWLSAPSAGLSTAIGAVAGLIVLTRHANALFLAWPVLYGVTGAGSLRARALFFRVHWRRVATAAAAAALVVAPQVAFYRSATGEWLMSPYGALGTFRFASPRIAAVLLSPEKGLFFWSPILLLGLVGLFRPRPPLPQVVAPAALILVAHTYLIASWSDWQLGGSYGHRGFTDVLPLLALGLGAFFSSVRGTRAAPVVAAVVALAIALSVFQMVQYWMRIIPPSDTSWALYRSIFLRLRP